MVQPGVEVDHRAQELEENYSVLKFCAVDFALMVLVMILHEMEGISSFISYY